MRAAICVLSRYGPTKLSRYFINCSRLWFAFHMSRDDRYGMGCACHQMHVYIYYISVINEMLIDKRRFNVNPMFCLWGINNNIRRVIMMTSSNGNIFRVTGHLCGEFTGPKSQWHRALMFSLICVWINGWVNNREAGDLRRHRANYNVRVMSCMCVTYTTN